jgi:hypothetical protein
MLAKSNGKTHFSQIEWLTTEAVAKHKEEKPEEAIAFHNSTKTSLLFCNQQKK